MVQRNEKKNLPWDFKKSVLGRSIFHYYQPVVRFFICIMHKGFCFFSNIEIIQAYTTTAVNILLEISRYKLLYCYMLVIYFPEVHWILVETLAKIFTYLQDCFTERKWKTSSHVIHLNSFSCLWFTGFSHLFKVFFRYIY